MLRQNVFDAMLHHRLRASLIDRYTARNLQKVYSQQKAGWWRLDGKLA